MKQDKGAYLRKIIEEQDYTVTEVAEMAGIGRVTLHRWMDNPRLPLKKLLTISQLLNVDIAHDFPESMKLIDLQKKKEAEAVKHDETIPIQKKYMSLLEEYNSILRELSTVKEELIRYKTGTKSAQEE